jgi:hypothetical protein
MLATWASSFGAMRRFVPLLACAMALGGCEAAGEPGGSKTFSAPDVPFTFQVPADFAEAEVDQGATRGDVVAAAGLTKVDVIAARRVSGLVVRSGPLKHTVAGHRVTSELHEVGDGWLLECQYSDEYRERILDACRTALRTLERG